MFLLLGAVQPDLVDAQVGMGAVAEPDSGRGPAQLLHRNRVFEVPHPGPAVFLLDSDAENTEITHLAPEVGWKVVRPLDVGRPRRHLVGGKGTDRVPEHVSGFTEIEVQARKVIRDHGLPSATGAAFCSGCRAADNRTPSDAGVTAVQSHRPAFSILHRTTVPGPWPVAAVGMPDPSITSASPAWNRHRRAGGQPAIEGPCSMSVTTRVRSTAQVPAGPGREAVSHS